MLQWGKQGTWLCRQEKAENQNPDSIIKSVSSQGKKKRKIEKVVQLKASCGNILYVRIQELTFHYHMDQNWCVQGGWLLSYDFAED